MTRSSDRSILIIRRIVVVGRGCSVNIEDALDAQLFGSTSASLEMG
jgi:hypothetical protein